MNNLLPYFGFSIWLLASSFFEHNYAEDFFEYISAETLVILLAVLLPIKSPVAYAAF